MQALQLSDIGVLVLDGTKPVSKQDKRIASMAMEEGKGLIFLVNKIDLLTSEQKVEKAAEIKLALRFCAFIPVITCSAETREGLGKILTSSPWFNETARVVSPPAISTMWFQGLSMQGSLGAIAKSKHVTQADELPPTFVLFVRNPRKVQLTQLKFLDANCANPSGSRGLRYGG